MTRRQILQRVAATLAISTAAKPALPFVPQHYWPPVLAGIDLGAGTDRTCVTYGRLIDGRLHITGHEFL